MTLKRYNGSSFETVPFRRYDGTNWRGTPIYRYSGTEWVDAYLDDGLQLYYPFDGDVDDYSGNGNDGIDNTSAGYVSGRIGDQAKDFDGVDDDVKVSNSLGFTNSTDHTISMWFKTPSPGDFESLFGYSDADSNLLEIRQSSSDFQYLLGQGVDLSASASDSVSADTWHHGVVTFDSSAPSIEVFVDNTSLASDSGSVGDFASSDTSRIGARDADGSTQNNFEGVIDDVRVYNTQLSTSEIDHLYQHGRVI